MISTKQRAYLRSLANTEKAIMQIGKEGITENLIKTVGDALEAREIVKLSVLETCPYTPKECMQLLQSALRCEAVQVIGRRVVIYRESVENRKIFLPN